MIHPRPRKGAGGWTWDDHLENARRIQRERDRAIFDRLGRRVGVTGRELIAALSRLIDDPVDGILSQATLPLADHLMNPDTADAVRNAIVDLIVDDLAEMIQILTRKRRKHDSRDTEETPGRGGAHAADDERPLHSAGDAGDAGGQPGKRRARRKRPG